MDVESPRTLERFRDQPEIKAVLLRLGPSPTDREARFERASRNTNYWPAILALAAEFVAAGRSEEVREPRTVYGRPCWLLATHGGSSTGAFSVAIAAADGAPVTALQELLVKVSDDYWHGSYFWK